MGPDRSKFCTESAYRLSCAAYSGWWLLVLGAGLAVLLVLRPAASAPPALFVLFFLYIGFGLGTLAALLAAVGFLVGGLWARWLEADEGRARAWRRFKQYAYASLAGLVVSAAYAFVAYGVLSGATVFPSRDGIFVNWAEDRLWFVGAMAFWFWVCISGPRHLMRALREARAI
jgi:hypothetical protein